MIQVNALEPIRTHVEMWLILRQQGKQVWTDEDAEVKKIPTMAKEI